MIGGLKVKWITPVGSCWLAVITEDWWRDDFLLCFMADFGCMVRFFWTYISEASCCVGMLEQGLGLMIRFYSRSNSDC